MIKYIDSVFIIIILSLTGCYSNTDKTVSADTIAPSFQKQQNKFAGVVFASKKDTSCGMPLNAGLEDTVRLNGKVYGFCSQECKQDFVNKLISENKR